MSGSVGMGVCVMAANDHERHEEHEKNTCFTFVRFVVLSLKSIVYDSLQYRGAPGGDTMIQGISWIRAAIQGAIGLLAICTNWYR
jgi:hypothetical protein